MLIQNGAEQIASKIGAEDTEGRSDENPMAEQRTNAEMMRRNEGQGALHHQCIDELTSHIRFAHQKVDEVQAKPSGDEEPPTAASRSETPTSFVTVIEVKDSSPVTCSSPSLPTSASLPTSPASISVIASTSVDEAPSGDESTARTEEVSTSAANVQNIEVKRKIPPR